MLLFNRPPTLGSSLAYAFFFFFQVLFCFGNQSCADTRNHPGAAAKTITCHRRGSSCSRLQPSGCLAAKNNPMRKTRTCCCSSPPCYIRTEHQKCNSLTFHLTVSVLLVGFRNFLKNTIRFILKCQ